MLICQIIFTFYILKFLSPYFNCFLYGTNMSAPSRAVVMAADLFGIDLDIREVNLDKSEQLAENFENVNYCFFRGS